MTVKGLHHVGIYTKSVDESLAFYTDILEFQKQWRGTVDHPTGRLDVAIISAGDCVIELGALQTCLSLPRRRVLFNMSP